VEDSRCGHRPGPKRVVRRHPRGDEVRQLVVDRIAGKYPGLDGVGAQQQLCASVVQSSNDGEVNCVRPRSRSWVYIAIGVHSPISLENCWGNEACVIEPDRVRAWKVIDNGCRTDPHIRPRNLSAYAGELRQIRIAYGIGERWTLAPPAAPGCIEGRNSSRCSTES